jgi:excisionase family DNA binding protein
VTMPAEANDALTVAEVARELRLSEKTVRRAIKSGDLVAHKVCAHWRIFRRDVEEWVAAGRNVTHLPALRPRHTRPKPRHRGSLRALETLDGERSR